MAVLRPDQIRVMWYGTPDGEERALQEKRIGWVAFVPFPLGKKEMEKIKEITLKTIRDRYASLPQGPGKDIVAKTLMLLERGRILQMLLTDEERDRYQASLPKDDRKIISAS